MNSRLIPASLLLGTLAIGAWGCSSADDEPTLPTKHFVEPGDTLSVLARKYYGDTERWRDIQAANKAVLENPSKLKPGQILVIPKLEAQPTGAGETAPTTQVKAATDEVAKAPVIGPVIVREGETWASLAEKAWGAGDYDYLIKQANPELLKEGDRELIAGQRVIIPPFTDYMPVH